MPNDKCKALNRIWIFYLGNFTNMLKIIKKKDNRYIRSSCTGVANELLYKSVFFLYKKYMEKSKN